MFKAAYAKHTKDSKHAKGNEPSGSLMRDIRRIAVEVDCLHPVNAIGGSRPDNCEYPWELKNTPQVRAPAEHDFVLSDLMRDRNRVWMELVKIIKTEMDRLIG